MGWKDQEKDEVTGEEDSEETSKEKLRVQNCELTNLEVRAWMREKNDVMKES